MTDTTAIRRILVGVDGSEGSAAALRWAMTLAGAADAEIIAVHAFDLQPYPPAAIGAAVEDTYLEPLRDSVRKAFEGEWSRPLKQAGLRHQLIFRKGPAGPVLLEVAEDQHVDLVVTGRRGLDAVAEVFAGSVSQYLVHKVPRCPIVIVPPPVETRTSHAVEVSD